MTDAGSPNAPQSPAPSADPATGRRLELGRSFAHQLQKAIKQIAMYRHAESRFREFLQPAQELLSTSLEQHGPLVLKVEPENLLLLGQPLFEEGSQLPFRFYREGIRQLVFRPGFTTEELVQLTLIATSDGERGEELIAQLWRANLEHLEYVVVEGFKLDDATEQEVEVEVDQVVGYLYDRLKASSDDYLRFARVSAEDLDLQMEGVDQLRGAVITGVTADDALKAKIQREIAEEENARLFPKLVGALFQVMEGGLQEAALLSEVLVQLLDALLLQEDFATLNQVVQKLRALAQRGLQGATSLRDTFLARMAEEHRVLRLAEVLKQGKPKGAADVVRYIQALELSALPALLSVLQTVESPEGRALLCDVLVQHAQKVPEPFVELLSSPRAQTVRDMVTILDRCGHPDRLKMFARVLKHPNLAVRLEVMSVVARSNTGEARKLVAEALGDPTMQVRMLAARLLPEFDREAAFQDLVRVIRDPGFERKSPEERAAMYSALGSTGLPSALGLLTQQLQTKATLFNKQKVTEEKLLAIHGLAGAASVHALRALQAVVEDKGQPTEVLTAARKAIYQVKKVLFPDARPEPGAPR